MAILTYHVNSGADFARQRDNRRMPPPFTGLAATAAALLAPHLARRAFHAITPR